MGNVVNFNSACKIITKESDAKSHYELILQDKSNSESRLEEFMNLSKERLTFVCVVCNRCF